MQHLDIKLVPLTASQRFFIQRSVELLDKGSLDSHRVRLHNPKSILRELEFCIYGFEKGQIKKFIAIVAKTDKQASLKDEALLLLKKKPNYLKFTNFSQTYLISILSELKETNYKQVRSCLKILLRENSDYLSRVLLGLKGLLTEVPSAVDLLVHLHRISQSLDILFSELQERGFSKQYLVTLVFGVFVTRQAGSGGFIKAFEDFENVITSDDKTFSLIFRLDTTKEICAAIRSSGEMDVSDSLEEAITARYRNHEDKTAKEYKRFSESADTKKFIRIKVQSADHFAALKKAKIIFGEHLDILNLGFSGEQLSIHGRALVIDDNNPSRARFQSTSNFLDGKYVVDNRLYRQFLEKLPALLINRAIHPETREKIKSAVRYLRLGNEATEVEHKFMNYWIGLEYLFSSYESSGTIERLKDYFIVCHSIVYVKRNLFDFYKDLKIVHNSDPTKITKFTDDPTICLCNVELYQEVTNLYSETFPLLAYRAWELGKLLVIEKSKNGIDAYISKHKKNLEIHLTRIYRIRNEIIHDAATNPVSEQLAAHLRYYLTFILNGAIDFLSGQGLEAVGIEDYFTMNEIYYGSLKDKGWPLEDLLAAESSFDFM